MINGKFYHTKHAAERLYDGHLGRGLALKAALRKYGRAAFEYKILGIYDTAEEVDRAEAKLITPDLIKSDQCYNLIPGGAGGRSSDGQGGQRRTLIDWNGVIIEGRICVIADRLGISQKRIQDVVAERRKCYRGLRAA